MELLFEWRRVNTFGEPSSMGNLRGGTGGLPLAGVVAAVHTDLIVYTTNNTKDQPYPNGTLCYEPSYCNPAPNRPWIQGWNCLPVFSCTNTARIIGRLWFVCTTSIVLGIAHVGTILWLVYYRQIPLID